MRWAVVLATIVILTPQEWFKPQPIHWESITIPLLLQMAICSLLAFRIFSRFDKALLNKLTRMKIKPLGTRTLEFGRWAPVVGALGSAAAILQFINCMTNCPPPNYGVGDFPPTWTPPDYYLPDPPPPVPPSPNCPKPGPPFIWTAPGWPSPYQTPLA